MCYICNTETKRGQPFVYLFVITHTTQPRRSAHLAGFFVLKMEIKITGNLPTLNEWISASRANKYKSAALKKKTEAFIVWQVLAQKVKIPDCKHDIVCTWVRTNNRTDPDNMEFATKFIFDALQKAGAITNDGRKQINDKMHIHVLDRDAKERSVFIEFVEAGKLKSFYK